MGLQLGIALALLCALTTNLGFLLKHRGAVAAPAVNLRRPWASTVALFSSKWFAIGMLVAVGAWVFHVGAMALAPLSMVQAVISGGLVFLTLLAERWFGCDVGLRQWAGVACTALGLALLAVTLPGGDSHGYSVAAMIAFEASLLAIGAFLVFTPRFGVHHEHAGALLGIAAGILFGVSDVAIKALTEGIAATGVLNGLVSPWLVTCVLASVLAFFASARGLQKGEAVPVITMTSAAANVSCISGGILVFGDPIPGDALGIVVQCVAFLLVIGAAAIMPAPVRAVQAQTA
jgi:drug/metabolite transporter (DMT)-like permease